MQTFPILEIPTEQDHRPGMTRSQLWPHSQLSLAYVSKDKGYDELTLTEFSAENASIVKLPSLSETERNARLDHFTGLMYVITQYPWPAACEFHTAVLFAIECDHDRWGDGTIRNEMKSPQHICAKSLTVSWLVTFRSQLTTFARLYTFKSRL